GRRLRLALPGARAALAALDSAAGGPSCHISAAGARSVSELRRRALLPLPVSEAPEPRAGDSAIGAGPGAAVGQRGAARPARSVQAGGAQAVRRSLHRRPE